MARQAGSHKPSFATNSTAAVQPPTVANDTIPGAQPNVGSTPGILFSERAVQGQRVVGNGGSRAVRAGYAALGSESLSTVMTALRS